MSFCLRPNVCKKCGKPLTMLEGWTCLECEKAEQEPYDDTVLERQTEKSCQYRDEDGCCWTDEKCKYQSNDEVFCQKQTDTQNPCEDAISREDARMMLTCEIKDGMTITEYIKMVDKRLKKLPPVRPQEQTGDWIPVSERLPKIAGVYRVTRYYTNNVMNPQYLVDACCFDGSNTWHDDNRINHERFYADNVIAWQENPEPYKAESEEQTE